MKLECYSNPKCVIVCIQIQVEYPISRIVISNTRLTIREAISTNSFQLKIEINKKITAIQVSILEDMKLTKLGF